MKKIYNAPEANEILLTAKDVITASQVSAASTGDGISADWDNG